MPRQFVVALVLAAGVAPLDARQNPRKPAPLEPIAPLVVADLLDTYAAGAFDEAVGAVAKAGDVIGQNLRRRWLVDGQAWIEADPAGRSRRALVAAALALETEHLSIERGNWGIAANPPCGGPCVLDWAAAQLAARGAPDPAERAWHLAAAALVGGVRDWPYLYRPLPRTESGPGAWIGGASGDAVGVPSGPPRAALPGLLDRALLRFPDDPHLRLEHAMAAASRFAITTDGVRNPINLGLPPAFAARGRGNPSLDQARATDRQRAAALLDSLAADPIVGAEASLRKGYLQWASGQDNEAAASLVRAAADARDADTEYLARFLLGWTALTRGEAEEAIPHLRAALEARPDSQSAAIALASLRLQQGEATAAYDIAQASMDRRPGDDDPWRTFLYGHYRHLRARFTDLRRWVRP